MFRPIVSRWSPDCAGELFGTCRTTLMQDDTGGFWLRRQWPIDSAKIPTMDSIDKAMADLTLSSCSVNTSASGHTNIPVGCVSWKKRGSMEFEDATGMRRFKSTRDENRHNAELGVIVTSAADLDAERFCQERRGNDNDNY